MGVARGRRARGRQGWLNSSLPAQYRDFLAQANGGCPEFACYLSGGVSVYLQYVYEISDRDPDDEGLEDYIREYAAPIGGRRKLVPIARGGQDDELFASLKDGSIYYLDPDEIGPKPIRIEDSLGHFLGKLRSEFVRPKKSHG